VPEQTVATHAQPVGLEGNSLGQRPRKPNAPPRQTTLKGWQDRLMARMIARGGPGIFHRPGIVAPLQGAGVWGGFSWGVAPGYCLSPLQGEARCAIVRASGHQNSPGNTSFTRIYEEPLTIPHFPVRSSEFCFAFVVLFTLVGHFPLCPFYLRRTRWVSWGNAPCSSKITSSFVRANHSRGM